MRFLPGLIILVLGFQWAVAFGEEMPSGQPPVPEDNKPAGNTISADEGYIDRSHAYVSRLNQKVVTWFDDLFRGEDDNDAGKAENKLRWSNELRAEKGKNLSYHTSIHARLRLPMFKKKVHLVIAEENREEAVVPVPSDPGTPVVNTPTEANSFRAVHTEFRYYAYDTKAGHVFLAAGSRFVWPPETFVRAQLLWRHPLSDNTFISPSVTPFWQDHIGFGITPQLNFGHTLPRNYFFLWANSATVYREKTGLLWGTEVSLSHILSPVSAIAYAVGATGSTHSSLVADRYNMAANNYKTTVRYRRNIYRPWLFVELIPEVNWMRGEIMGREFVQAFTVRLEINSAGPRALLPVPPIVQEQSPIPESLRH